MTIKLATPPHGTHHIMALPALLAMLLMSYGARAEPATTVAVEQPVTIARSQALPYLAPNTITPTALPKPDALQSHAWRRDIMTILQMQKYVVPIEIDVARTERDVTPEMMTRIIGHNFKRDALPRTFALLDRVGKDSHIITKAAKDYWRVPRPYLVDKRVKLLIEALPANNYSYPSGHTSTSLVWARVLGDLLPDYRFALNVQAERIAAHRLIVGVHTPRDLAGGKELGELIVAKLQAVESYQADRQAALQELKTAGYNQPAAADSFDTPTATPKNWRSFPSQIAE
jgi:acid phosphatase (class A)